MWPAILGMTYAALPDSRAGLAGGVILGAAGIGNAAGPLIGGVLTDLLSWRWIFFLNLPVTAFAVYVTWRQIHQPQPKVDDERIDYWGIVTVSVGLVALLVAFDEVIKLGWGDARIIGLLALFAVLIVAFGFIERAARRSAAVPADVMRTGTYSYTCAAILLMSAVFFASMLYLPQFMPEDARVHADRGRLGMLPMMFVRGDLRSSRARSWTASGRNPGDARLALHRRRAGSDRGLRLGQSHIAIVPGLAIMGLGIGLCTRPPPPPVSPPWTSRAAASRGRSSTCSRSPAARSASASRRRC
jgi:MFS family permease